MSYDQVDEGVFTSAPAYSQPPVTTTTVSADTATATVVISYFPSIGDDGVTRTGTTTISTVSVGGEADYTTTVDRGNGRSGNEKPTQAAGTAGGSGSGSGSGSGPVHQSAGNIVPSGSPSVQNPMDTASPVSGIHSSQTPHSVPSQAQQQGQGQEQGQGQTPSSRQQAATTALLPSGSSVNNNGSGFSSTQTASVLQGKGASIRVASSSIVFSMIAVIVVGMI
ncbi:hypothetical protein AO442_005324 [Nakaseomyces glabratus]|nr:hypothetical protein AO442_005324 [Nakaseomyces glabratus]